MTSLREEIERLRLKLLCDEPCSECIRDKTILDVCLELGEALEMSANHFCANDDYTDGRDCGKCTSCRARKTLTAAAEKLKELK